MNYRNWVLILLLVCVPVCANEALQRAVDNPWRAVANSMRDEYRHPYQTLTFFDVQLGQQVLEIWPGKGWYTEVLGPYLNEQGQLTVAHFPADSSIEYFRKLRAEYAAWLEVNLQQLGRVAVVDFYPPTGDMALAANSQDRVLTFRNVHNWMKSGFADKAFADFFRVLKPGGLLGVVEHRAKPDTLLETMILSGYVTEDHVKALALDAGFEFVGSSEINANPKDMADHPKGVWTLPPSLRLGDENRAKYLAIGESDRMTLMFRKPL